MLKYFFTLNVLLYLSFAYLYFFNAELTTIKPVHWYILSIGIGFPYLIFSGRIKLEYSSSRKIVVWALLFIFFSAISYSISVQPEVGLQTLISWSESLLLLILFVYILQDKNILYFSAKAIVVVVIVSVLLNYYDFVFPGMFSKDEGRAAGMYENANISGKFLVFAMVLSVWVFPKKLRSAYCLFVASGIVVTFSRSSMMLWALAMLLLAWKDAFVIKKGPSVIAMGVIMLLLAGSLASGVWYKAFQAVGFDSYLSENTINRIGGSFTEQKDDSSAARRYVASYAWGLFIKSPIVGHGLGSTQAGNTAVGAHNMYLRLAVEMGILGFLFVVSLIVILWRAKNNVGMINGVLYVFSSLFTHNSIEQPAMQVVIAMSVAGYIKLQNSADANNRYHDKESLSSKPELPLAGGVRLRQ